MPIYYVQSGDIQRRIEAKTPREAVEAAFREAVFSTKASIRAALIATVSRHGFTDGEIADDDVLFNSQAVLDSIQDEEGCRR